MFSNHCPSNVTIKIIEAQRLTASNLIVIGWPNERDDKLANLVRARIEAAGFTFPDDDHVVVVGFPDVSSTYDVGANDNVADKVTELLLAETGQMFTYSLRYSSQRFTDPANIDAPAELRSLRVAVFGHLVGFAENVVKMHRGDLFHDAMWLDEWMTGEAVESDTGFTFCYGVRESGTGIGTDRALIESYNDQSWRLNVRRNKRGWALLTVTPLTTGEG